MILIIFEEQMLGAMQHETSQILTCEIDYVKYHRIECNKPKFEFEISRAIESSKKLNLNLIWTVKNFRDRT